MKNKVKKVIISIANQKGGMGSVVHALLKKYLRENNIDFK